MTDQILKIGTLGNYGSSHIVIHKGGVAPCVMENHGEITRVLIEYDIQGYE